MKLKVCGIKDYLNLKELAALEIDYVGFIFVESSKREVKYSDCFVKEINRLNCRKVGVFVNETTQVIREKAKLFGLNTIQLHGDESSEQIKDIARDYFVIKAFSVDEDFNFQLEKYTYVDYYLFDTKGDKRGGNGVKFNWGLLDKYKGNTPFFLSGGIGPKDVSEILKINHSMFAGVDVNSAFEIKPGLKNINELKTFIQKLKQ